MDVLHVLYEEDLTATHEQYHEVQSKVRSSVYRQLYDREYAYQTHGDAPDAPEEQLHSPTSLDTVVSRDPSEMSTKPYVPPTPVENLSDLLDGPLG